MFQEVRLPEALWPNAMLDSDWLEENADALFFFPGQNTKVFPSQVVSISLSVTYELWLAVAAAAAKSLQSCPTLSDPMDCSLPGSSVHGIFQARVLEWGAIAFSGVWQLLGLKLGH